MELVDASKRLAPSLSGSRTLLSLWSRCLEAPGLYTRKAVRHGGEKTLASLTSRRSPQRARTLSRALHGSSALRLS